MIIVAKAMWILPKVFIKLHCLGIMTRKVSELFSFTFYFCKYF